MLKQVGIGGFKCFAEEIIDFTNLTIITGPNSSGKSSLLQAVLIAFNPKNDEVMKYLASLGDYADLKNKGLNPLEFIIKLFFDDRRIITYTRDVNKISQMFEPLVGSVQAFEGIRLYYLNAHREPVRDTQLYVNSDDIGIYANNTLGYFERNKDVIVDGKLQHPDAAANTLEAQVNYWLAYISDTPAIFYTEKITSTIFRSYYKLQNNEFKPQNLGAGISYLIAIISKSLLITSDDMFLIENPEIHLHPKSQARLADFFAFVASTGRQIILETHSEHLISKLRYCVYKKQIESAQVIIQYRQPDKFEKIEILSTGKLNNEYGENSFPSGFFDATLDGLFEINSR